MGGALLSYGLDWLAVFTRRVVFSDPETILDPARVSLRTSMVNSLYEHGDSGMAGLEAGRVHRGEPRPDSVRCSTDSERSVVLDFLRHEDARFSVCGDSGVVGNDTCNYVGLLASKHHRWHSLLAVSGLGIIRCILELLDLAVE